MRLLRLALPSLLAFAALPACVVHGSDVTDDDLGREPVTMPAPAPSPPRDRTERTPRNAPIEVEQANADFGPTVYVFMRARDQSRWICTGTLTGPRTVITAAHCLEPTMFVRYEIVAPHAPGAPRVSASTPKIFGGSYEQVENPDIGWLTLDADVHLPAYAELTDVVDRVEAGEALEAAAVVRTAEEAEAPLFETAPMPLSSAVPLGYAYGFSTPMFSKGGDSGAGLFLVEDGKRTFKLIGVARQPEPDRGIDHFTRIDAAFLAFHAANTTTK